MLYTVHNKEVSGEPRRGLAYPLQQLKRHLMTTIGRHTWTGRTQHVVSDGLTETAHHVGLALGLLLTELLDVFLAGLLELEAEAVVLERQQLVVLDAGAALLVHLRVLLALDETRHHVAGLRVRVAQQVLHTSTQEQ